MSRFDDVMAQFPWLQQVPGLADDILSWIEQGYTDGELVASIRLHQAYLQRFPAMKGDDGGFRFQNEAEYLAEERRLREVLIQYGAPGHNYDDPQDFAAMLAGGVRAGQLQARYDLYNSLSTSGQGVIDAFYIYAGMEIGVDDLYEMVVNPSRQNELIEEYEARSTINPPDMDTFITRLTETSMVRVVRLLDELAQAGVVDRSAVSQIQSADPAQAKTLVAALYGRQLAQGLENAQLMTDAVDNAAFDQNLLTDFIDVPTLQHSFQLALIGSAATRAGLDIPDAARLDDLISAGLDRSRAIQGFSTIANRSSEFQAFARRANLGDLSQEEIEDEVLLGTEGRLAEALRREQALGARGGGVRFETDRFTGALRQPGLRDS
jgi:hypothetical protein